jgi:hypothetical protein
MLSFSQTIIAEIPSQISVISPEEDEEERYRVDFQRQSHQFDLPTLLSFAFRLCPFANNVFISSLKSCIQTLLTPVPSNPDYLRILSNLCDDLMLK